MCVFSETLCVFFAGTLKLCRAEPQVKGVYHFGQDLRSGSISRSGTWDLPGPGIEPLSPASAGGCFATEPPGKPRSS